MERPADDEWEQFILVSDHWDGPMRGIVPYRGYPHLFCCPFDDDAQDFPDFYCLSPLPSEYFAQTTELGLLKKTDRRLSSSDIEARIEHLERALGELHVDHSQEVKSKFKLRRHTYMKEECYFPIVDEWEIKFLDDSPESYVS